MKKFFIAIAALAALAAPTQAATFIFQSTAVGDNPILDVRTGAAATGADNIVARVVMSTTEMGAFEAVTEAVSLGSGAQAGFVIDPSERTVNTIGGQAVAPGQTVFFQIQVWDADLGTFETSSVKGVSEVGSVVLGGGQPPAPGGIVSDFSSFTIQVVPEPSVFVLGLLGGIGFLFRRRR